jgi:hypothetical protein
MINIILRPDSVIESNSGLFGPQPPEFYYKPALADSMYRCEICSDLSKPNTPAHKLILKTRTTIYPKRPKVFACWKRVRDGTKFTRTDDPGGVGQQIVREVTVCLQCAKANSMKSKHINIVLPQDLTMAA